jgi:hypothetical protein
LGKGLLREHVASLDIDLGKALENYLSPLTNKSGKKVIPPDFDLPTRKESNDRWVSRILQSRGSSELTEEIVKNAARQAIAARRQLQKGDGVLTADQVRELGREASTLRRRWEKERTRG